MSQSLKIAHLYPDVLNLYGDQGNLFCLRRRLEWRGMSVQVENVPIGERGDFAGYDMIFLGGGQDFERTVLLEDLRGGKQQELCAAIADGVPVLAICGGYQLLGHWYEGAGGERCEYLGAVDFTTTGAATRLTGNYVFQLSPEDGGSVVVGFENHGGRTHLGSGVRPLGTVLVGHGNNGEDGGEGVRYKNVFGTYSHGPLLPKNPALSDRLLAVALERKYGTSQLAPLDDAAENAARNVMLQRLMPERKG